MVNRFCGRLGSRFRLGDMGLLTYRLVLRFVEQLRVVDLSVDGRGADCVPDGESAGYL